MTPVQYCSLWPLCCVVRTPFKYTPPHPRLLLSVWLTLASIVIQKSPASVASKSPPTASQGPAPLPGSGMTPRFLSPHINPALHRHPQPPACPNPSCCPSVRRTSHLGLNNHNCTQVQLGLLLPFWPTPRGQQEAGAQQNGGAPPPPRWLHRSPPPTHPLRRPPRILLTPQCSGLPCAVAVNSPTSPGWLTLEYLNHRAALA